MKSFQTFFCSFAALAMLLIGSTMMTWGQSAASEDEVRAEVRLFLWQTGVVSISTEESKGQSTENGSNKPAEFFVAKGKEYQPVNCEAQEYSAPVLYQGPRKFQLYRRGDASKDAGAFVPIAEVMLPTGGGRYVLFLDGGAKKPRILVFPYDTGNVGKGQLLLFNATDRGLGVCVGTERKTIAPNALVTFSVASFTNYQMPFAIFEKSKNKDKEEWLQRMSTRHAILFDDRNLGILYQRPNDSGVAFALLPNVAWESPKAQ